MQDESRRHQLALQMKLQEKDAEITRLMGQVFPYFLSKLFEIHIPMYSLFSGHISCQYVRQRSSRL